MRRKYPKTLICEYCKKEYSPRKPSSKGDGVLRRFCSLECKLNGHTKPVVICLNCGKAFKARATNRAITGRQKFCSKECRWVYERKNTKNVTLNCERCGNEFTVYPSQLKQGNPRFCSQSCAGNMKKWKNERFRRLKTSTWSEIRESILKRDEYRCAKCGGENKLTVHHIKRWSLSKDDSPSNLITLCRSCHWSIEWNGVPCPVPKT